MPEIDRTSFISSGQVTIAGGTLDSNGNPIGGLSGITYNSALNVYYAICDTRNNGNGPVRFYTLSINLNAGTPLGVSVTGVTTLKDARGNPYAPNVSDTEGIALTSNGSVFISSEGVLDTPNFVPPYVNPFVREFSLATGNQINDLTIPTKFIPTGNLADPGFIPNFLAAPITPTSGVRRNLAFESLTLTPDQQFLFTGTEAPLAQDSSTLAIGLGNSRNRILRFDNVGGAYTPAAEFVYQPDFIAQRLNGLSDLLAINSNTLIALERSAASATGPITTRLYEVSLVGATDIRGNTTIPAGTVPVTKTLIADLSNSGLGNIEGLTFGPTLPNGRQSLILLGDNNFDTATPTRLATFNFAFTTNNAPALTPALPKLTAIPEDPTTNNGDLISTIVGTSIVDYDTGALKGIAVTGVDNTNGTWDYSIDNGLTWTGFGTPSRAAARLLADNARIRFRPNPNYSGEATISYQAWDRTSGTNGGTANLAVPGSTGLVTAFSTVGDRAAIAVNAVADAPTLTVNPASGNPNTAIPLSINTALVDTDGSESLSVQIAGVPASASLSAGTNVGNGIWQLTLAQLANLTITPSTDNNFTLSVTATSTERSNSSTTSTVANLSVTVNSGPINPNPSNPGQPLTPIQNLGDILSIPGNAGQTQLLFRLSDNDSALVNEVGVFVVDDDQGTVNGITPDSAGYLQAALSRARVIFSALSSPPNGFGVANQTRVLSFNPNERLSFYFVQNSTTDTVLADLAAGETPSNVFFALASGNTDGFDHLQLSNQGSGIVLQNWEEGVGGGDQDFNDLVMTIQPTSQSQSLGASLQGESQRELLDLRNQTGELQAQFIVNREAAFDNFCGFYRVADVNGGIDTDGNGTVDLRPGEAGYVEAAIGQRVSNLDLTVANQSSATFTAQLQGGFLYAPFLIANGRPEELLDGNTSNNPAVYVPFLGANADGVDHLRLLGDNIFGFEDLPGGGDRDYNDVLIQVTLTA